MNKHYILLGSSYETGERIAYAFSNEDYSMDKVGLLLEKINGCSNKTNIATHTLSTCENGIESIKKSDPFFEDVTFLKDQDDFISFLQSNTDIKALDVANYIIFSVNECTHTKLEKLVYYCYADYLCRYRQKLFRDKIYSYKYGPVIKSVYDCYKKTDNCTYVKKITDPYNLSIKSRILNSVNGFDKVDSIDKTINKYKHLTAQELSDLTHKQNTPWTQSGAGNFSDVEILDEYIFERHRHEEIH